MNPWLEVLGVALLAVAGGGLGLWFSRRKTAWWLCGYFLPLVIVILIALARRFINLTFLPPFSWFINGRTPFVLLAFAGPLLLTTPLSRLRFRRDRAAVVILIFASVAYASLWPFAASAWNRTYLQSLETQIDADGICRQSTDYTCGPAAAVTALRRLGFSAEEGDLAVRCHTSEAMGTPPDILAGVLREQYGPQGLRVIWRSFDTLEELEQVGLTLVVIKFGLLVDHYQVLQGFDGRHILVADPLLGKHTMARDEFARKWRFTGIVLQRESP